MQEKNIHVLHIPRWFPGREDPQNGIFIQKHINSLSVHCFSSVIIVRALKGLKETSVIDTEKSSSLYIANLYYRKRTFPVGIGKLINSLLYVYYFLSVFNKVRREYGNPHLMHVHVMLRTALMALLLKGRYGIPYIISEHWSGYVNGNFRTKPFFYKFLCRFAAKKAKAVSAVSSLLKEGLIKSKLSYQVEVIPNIVEIPPVKSIILPPEKVVRFITVADLVDKVKNISGILNALGGLKDSLPAYEYHIIGDGPDRKMLEEIAGQVKNNDNKIFFYGRKKNDFVHALLPSMNFMVLNSYLETFGVSLAEALLHGVPVVSSRSGGPESFIDESNGILVEYGNKAELQKALIQMMQDYHKYDPRKCRRNIINTYSSEATGKRLWNWYTQWIS